MNNLSGDSRVVSKVLRQEHDGINPEKKESCTGGAKILVIGSYNPEKKTKEQRFKSRGVMGILHPCSDWYSHYFWSRDVAIKRNAVDKDQSKMDFAIERNGVDKAQNKAV